MDKYNEYDRIVAKNLSDVIRMANGKSLCIHNINLKNEKHLYVLTLLRMCEQLYGVKVMAHTNLLKKIRIKKKFGLDLKITVKNCIPYLYNMEEIVDYMVSSAETTNQRIIEIYNEYYK